MSSKTIIEVCETRLQINCDDKQIIKRITEEFKSFIFTDRQSDFKLSIRLNDINELKKQMNEIDKRISKNDYNSFEYMFPSMDLEHFADKKCREKRTNKKGTNRIIYIHTKDHETIIRCEQYVGIIDIIDKTASIYQLAGRDYDNIIREIISVIRLIYSNILIEKKAVILHASSIVYKDKTHLFAGESRSGKTTIAKLSTDKKIMNYEI